ncbi:GGDEF domain-containing protein [Halopseudomonas pachastrellae]|nr:GGDEF domain-containing protein [Halopseudomonas pachastrellae]
MRLRLVAPGAGIRESLPDGVLCRHLSAVRLVCLVFAHRARVQRRLLALQATIDPLTGIGNRRTMDAELDIAMADSKRYGIDFGLLVLDLDYFKQINDRFGHGIGDQVLVDLLIVSVRYAVHQTGCFALVARSSCCWYPRRT